MKSKGPVYVAQSWGPVPQGLIGMTTSAARATATHPEEETLVRSVKLLKEIQFAPVWWPRHLVLTTDRV